MAKYDKVLYRSGKKLLYQELMETQAISVDSLGDYSKFLYESNKGYNSLDYTKSTNKLTITANVLGWGKLFTLSSQALTLYPSTVTTDTEGEVYAEVREVIVTENDDHTIVDPGVGVATAHRIRYDIALKCSTVGLPADITDQDPGSNIINIPIAKVLGHYNRVPDVFSLYKELSAVTQADLAESTKEIRINIIDLGIEVETLKNATLTGVTANMLVESFLNLNDITLSSGLFDSVNEKVYLN